MRAVASGEVASERGAEIIQYDPEKVFDPSRSGVGTVRPYGTGGAGSKDFNFPQNARVGCLPHQDFAGAKAARRRAEKVRDRRRRYPRQIPPAQRRQGRSATRPRRPRSEGWHKDAATRDLLDGGAPYLGPESKKLGVARRSEDLANWRNGGETVIYNDGVVEKSARSNNSRSRTSGNC